MSDFKLSITNIADAFAAIAAIEAHGEDFDAARGDFVVSTVNDGTIEVLVKDVAKGDIQALVDDLHNEIEVNNPDRILGIRISQDIDHNGNWYPVDLDDDDYE